jgi:hypothetical protein
MDPSAPSTPPTETDAQRIERERREQWHAESEQRKKERFEEVRLHLRVAFGGVAFNALVQRGVNIPDALKQISAPGNITAIDNTISALFLTPVK